MFLSAVFFNYLFPNAKFLHLLKTENRKVLGCLQAASKSRQMSTYDSLNPFVPNAPFLYPLKTENTFLMFSGRREGVHWERMG